LPFAPDAGVVMTGATLFVTVNVLSTVLVLLQLSFAVKVTVTTPQKEVIWDAGGALSVFDIRPHPLSIAAKAARWAASHVAYWDMAVAQGAEPFCRLFVMTGGVTSGVTLII